MSIILDTKLLSLILAFMMMPTSVSLFILLTGYCWRVEAFSTYIYICIYGYCLYFISIITIFILCDV